MFEKRLTVWDETTGGQKQEPKPKAKMRPPDIKGIQEVRPSRAPSRPEA